MSEIQLLEQIAVTMAAIQTLMDEFNDALAAMTGNQETMLEKLDAITATIGRLAGKP